MQLRTALLALLLTTACAGPPPDVDEASATRAHLVLPLTGPLDGLGAPWRRTADLAAAQLNEAGLFGGGGFELVTHDEAIGLDESLTDVEDTGDALVVGPTLSRSVTDSMDRVVASPLTFLSPTATSSGLAGVDGVYRVSPDDRALAANLGELLGGGGFAEACEELGVIADANPYHLILAGGLEETFTAGDHFRVPVAAELTPEQASATRDALAAGFGPGRRCVALLVFPEDARNLLAAGAFENLGIDLIVVSDALTGFPLSFAPGRVVLGLHNTHGHGDAFSDLEEAYADAHDEPLPVFAAQVYDAVVLGGLALARSAATGEPLESALVELSRGDEAFIVRDLPSLREDVLSGASLDYRGASGVLDLDDDTHGSDGPFAVVQLQGDVWAEIGVVGQ